jgi:hypothetical protein
MKNKISLYSLSFFVSNKYIYAKIMVANSCVLSLSTSLFFFKELKAKNNIIATKLLALLFKKILFNKGLKINSFKKVNSKYSGKVSYFISILTGKNNII